MGSTADIIAQLPNELKDEILANLDVTSLIQLSSSSSMWYDYVHYHCSLWRDLCSRYDIRGTPEPTTTWKVLDVYDL